MNDEIQAVREWQSLFGRKLGTIDHTVSNNIKIVSNDTAQARVDFIQEELNEYLEANSKGDIIGVLDAILDILYFTFGMIVIHGLHNVATDGFFIVHKCNMSKLWPDGVRISGYGKVLKPDTFVRPERELEKLINNNNNKGT